MESEHIQTCILSALGCIFLCFVTVEARNCNASDNELKKITDTNAVKLGQQQIQIKADCVKGGGSYDERGSCYRGISPTQSTSP